MGKLISNQISVPFCVEKLKKKFEMVVMLKAALLLAFAAAVMGDNYLCANKGDEFKCFENKPDAKFCLSNGDVVCGYCRIKYDFCTKGLSQSKAACGADWESKDCLRGVGATY